MGDGVRLAEWNKGLFRAVFLNALSVGWFRRAMEELKQVGEIRDFCRTYRVGSTVLILQRRGNEHGRFLELSEYAFGGRRSSVMIPEGRVGCGWANCLAQLRRLEKSLERKAAGGKTGGNIPSAARKEFIPAFRDGRSFAEALIGSGSKLENGVSSKDNLGGSGEQPLSILARTEKQSATKEGGDCTAIGGAHSALNDLVASVEGQTQLADFKKLLVSIREEVTRWLDRLELGRVFVSPNQGQTDIEVGQVALGSSAQDQERIKEKGKEAAAQELCGSPQLTYKRRVLLKQKIQAGSSTESVEEKAEQRQISPMRSLEVSSELAQPGSGSGRLGSRDDAHDGTYMEDVGSGLEGDEGVIGELKSATEEASSSENQVSIVYSPGPAEIQEEEERCNKGSESGRLGKLELVSGLSGEAGDGREVGDKGLESPKQAEFEIGLGEMAVQCRGLEMIEVSGKVDEVNSLALMTSTEDNLGDIELLDVMPLAVLEKDLGVESSDWVLERISGFCKVVGISCPGLEEKMMELFNGIEAQRFSDRMRHNNNSSAMGNRGHREVKRLECSVNYDGKGGQSSRLTRKGRVGNCLC